MNPAIFLAEPAATMAPIGYDDISQILTSVTSQFSVSNIVAMIAVLLWRNCGHFLGSGQDCIELENRQCGQV